MSSPDFKPRNVPLLQLFSAYNCTGFLAVSSFLVVGSSLGEPLSVKFQDDCQRLLDSGFPHSWERTLLGRSSLVGLVLLDVPILLTWSVD